MTIDTATAPTASAPQQVAINDIGSEEDFLAAIDKTIKYFNDGDIVEGTIVKVDRDEVLLDIGYKTEGVIPSRELSIKHDVDPADVVKVGDEVEALVLQKEDKEGRLILSKKRAQYERAWGTIEELKEKDEPVKGTVIEVVKGGLILDIGLRGFLPASLVEMRRVRDLQPYVGRELEAKIIELDKNRNNVVLSRRAYLEQTQSEVRSEFLNALAKGQVRKGVVSSIVNFGAFVDLGGVDGLVHVSELSWKHIDHPTEVVEVGQEVTVEVLDVDMDRERVSLSLKATQEDPWQQFARTHQMGQIVPGKVTKLVPFGAFVRVEEGIEGLVHISELAERHVEIPEQVVQVGDEIFVKIIDIDLDRRRISLSLKQANEGTIGEAVIAKPSRNVIPGEIAFTVDCRSADAAIMDALDKQLRTAAAEIAVRRKVDVALDLVWRKPPTHFDPKLVDAVESASKALGYSHRRITSGAGHDACNLNTIMPAAMVFVPCKDGVSHNELEDATQADCTAGANVLMHTVLALAGVAS